MFFGGIFILYLIGWRRNDWKGREREREEDMQQRAPG